MPANNKWPDFRLASTLRSLIGAQPEDGVKTTNGDQSTLQGFTQGVERAANKERDPGNLAEATMADTDAHSIGETDAMNQLDRTDADFGDIEMFDSNAAPAPFSSQSAAPDAIMSEDHSLQSSSQRSKKEKKHKKERRKHSVDETANGGLPVVEEEDESTRKHRKSNRKSTKDVEIPDSQPHITGAAEVASGNADAGFADVAQEDRAAVSSSHAKNKRKLSNSADGKRQKKRRSHDQGSDGPDDNARRSSEETGSTGFLRKKKNKGGVTESAIYEEDEQEDDTRKSPTVAHLRRRSQSREARSRENSVPRSGQMDVDLGAQNDAQQALAALAETANLEAATDNDRDVEALAREAWAEHRNSQIAGHDAEPTEQYPQAPLDDAVDATLNGADPSSAKSRKTRSTRKKAKPTYFEQDPVPDLASDDDANRNAYDQLPSPSAMTPKPRRAKRAAKKESRGRKPKREKLSQSMRGGSDDEAGGSMSQRNRLTGYTQGRFTDGELARISRAVESFRADNGMSQHEVNELIHAPGGTTAGDTNAQLWVRIFAECPDRHRQKVINITRKKFHNFVARGTWTPEQDAELAELISVHGTKWSHIAGLINRHPEDLRDRYRNYIVCGANQRKDSWDENEEARLTQYVIEAMEAIDELRTNQPNRALLMKTYEELIDWQDVSERMDRTRSRLQCITKWKALNIRTHGKDKLVSSDPDSQISFRLEKARRQIAAMPSEERFRLVLAIQGTAVGSEGKIPWQRLGDKTFRNSWHRYSQMLLWSRLKQMVPNWQTSSVRDCAQYLVDQYNHHGDLPEIPDELFTDADEMEFMQTISHPTGSHGPGGEPISEEFVAESDGEGNHQGTNGDAVAEQPAEEPEDNEMKIDPALTGAPEPPKKRAPRKKNRKSTAAYVDPTDEAAVAAEQAADAERGGESEIDEEQYRKKKTPSKFKSPSAKRSNPSPAKVADDDSVMDDMEDIPA